MLNYQRVTGVNDSLNRILGSHLSYFLEPIVAQCSSSSASVGGGFCGFSITVDVAGQKMLSFTAMFALGPDF